WPGVGRITVGPQFYLNRAGRFRAPADAKNQDDQQQQMRQDREAECLAIILRRRRVWLGAVVLKKGWSHKQALQRRRELARQRLWVSFGTGWVDGGAAASP